MTKTKGLIEYRKADLLTLANELLVEVSSADTRPTIIRKIENSQDFNAAEALLLIKSIEDERLEEEMKQEREVARQREETRQEREAERREREIERQYEIEKLKAAQLSETASTVSVEGKNDLK